MAHKHQKKQKADLYFIAIIVGAEFGEEVTKIKQLFASRFNSNHALRSPPHITLHMPFKWRADKINHLLGELSVFVEGIKPFQIALDGFSSFPPRVIYIDVKYSDKLEHLQKEVQNVAHNRLKLLNSNYKNQAFHPHVTVAFRDLSKKEYQAAWKEFAEQKINHRLTACQIALLKHNGKSWDVYKTFEFGDKVE